MYENLPAVFEFARVMKGSPHKVALTYEEYLEYKDIYENMSNASRMEYEHANKNGEDTYVIKSIVLRYTQNTK